MKISILTLFPELYKPFLETSLLRRASESGAMACDVVSLLSLCERKKRIDTPTFGHGPGMLLRPETVENGIVQQEEKYGSAFKVFFSPHGKKLDQKYLQDLYKKIQEKGGHCALMPARYEGMDARVEEHYADAVISIGDYVLMGGDIPAMVFLEGLMRFVPGVIGQKESVEQDSFTGNWVDYPHYGAPLEWKGMKVPDVIRSGNHQALADWRENESIKRTVKGHFDWLRSQNVSQEDREKAQKYIPGHYAALMHGNILLRDGSEGTSSVTSIDIHDCSRSTKTYGIKKFFIVTPLEDQQKIVQKLLGFWQDGPGVTYNESRCRAIQSARLASNLDEVIDAIEKKEGKKPLLIATSASLKCDGIDKVKNITYYDQDKVWSHDRPVLFLFGTGNGLGPSVLQRCDYVLLPVIGFSSFNHLSVRSAIAIILDRWLGINIKYLEV